MAADTPPVTHRWWRDLRWLTAFAVGLSVAVLLWGLIGPETRVVVSRETTFITEPLRADGLPDYATHVLDRLGRGTPPEDNAAVAVLEATWPMELDADQLQGVCKALGIPDARPAVSPLVCADADEDLRRGLAELLGLDGDDPVAADDDLAIARRRGPTRPRPWNSSA